MFDFELFFGRFHPLIVHLPIGFLLLAIIFKGLDLRAGTTRYTPALKLTLLLAAVIAVITCLTGFLLSRAGTYPEDDLFLHQWSGIGLAVITIVWYFTEFRLEVRPIVNYWVLGVLTLLLVITGHRGGVLTHGETYLWEGLPVAVQQFFGHDPYTAEALEFEISNLDSALVYEDIVVPILQARCYSCHSDRKQKSELRLDSPELIRKGGESGDRLLSKDLGKSKLYHVLTLPLDEDAHMPPKGKTQLTKYEVEVIGSWVANGGVKGKMAMHYNNQEAINEWYDDLISDEKLFSNDLIPDEPVSPPNKTLMENLRKKDVLIQSVGHNNNYVEVSFINVVDPDSALIMELAKMKEQIIWVDVSGKTLEAAHIDGIASLSQTTVLNLSQSSLPENGLKNLSALKNLQILNLTGAKLENPTLEDIKDWPVLRKVFTFQSNISRESIMDFQKSHPEILIDTGGYILPEVPRDTLDFRYKK